MLWLLHGLRGTWVSTRDRKWLRWGLVIEMGYYLRYAYEPIRRPSPANPLSFLSIIIKTNLVYIFSVFLIYSDQ